MALIEQDVVPAYAVWHFMDSNHKVVQAFPQAHDLDVVRFADGRFQPFEYKWIDWIEIPRQYKPFPGIGLTRSQAPDLRQEVREGRDGRAGCRGRSRCTSRCH